MRIACKKSRSVSKQSTNDEILPINQQVRAMKAMFSLQQAEKLLQSILHCSCVQFCWQYLHSLAFILVHVSSDFMHKTRSNGRYILRFFSSTASAIFTTRQRARRLQYRHGSELFYGFLPTGKIDRLILQLFITNYKRAIVNVVLMDRLAASDQPADRNQRDLLILGRATICRFR
ncbi:hypothetical protein Tsp_02325 [Trichinella spiralis]|uniref:hypothetical protein n=1 Tax=Trichinella spiralis TaxID=6334 RepID=UPI0001EFCEA8|nr:hypothetical protein Tsp_02325 [Trichinella spiralis]